MGGRWRSGVGRGRIAAKSGQSRAGHHRRGNHFVEFQRIEAVVDEARFAALGLAQDRVWMMVHSGSRGLGQAVLQAHRQPDVSQGIPLAAPGLSGRP
jgi:RNA-splicing ligase RtcB